MNLQEARKKIPELSGLSDESALNVIHEAYYPKLDKADLAKRLGYTMPEPAVKPRSALRAVGDTAVQFGKGALTGVRMMSDVFGADNAVSGGLRTADDALAGLLSATAQKDQAQVAAIMQEAEGKGWMEQIGLGLKAAGVAPGALLAQAAGTAIPTLAASLATGGVGPMATMARFAAPALMGGAQGVGATKGAIYDEVKERLLKSGASPEEAQARAVDQQSYSGDSIGQIALGGGLGVLAGGTGMERVVAGLRGGVTKAAPGLVARMGVGGVTEMVPEMAQGGQEKYATNSALNNEGFKVDPMSGVVANATMEGAAGFGMGAAVGIPRPAVHAQQTAADAIRATELVPELGAMTHAVNAGTEAKARAVESIPTPSITGADPAQMLQDQAARSNPLMDQLRPSEAAGINPAAGPMSAAGAVALDSGATQAIELDEANAADQAAYDQATSDQEAQAAEQDTVDKPITTGKLAEAQLSEEDKRAILFSNQSVADGGGQYEGTQDGDVLNGLGAPFKTMFAALRRAQMEGKDWSIAPVFDGFVARRKEAMPAQAASKPVEQNNPTKSVGGNITTQAETEKQPNQPLAVESNAPVATENVAPFAEAPEPVAPIAQQPAPVPATPAAEESKFSVGQQVHVSNGLYAGATGTVESVKPSGKLVVKSDNQIGSRLSVDAVELTAGPKPQAAEPKNAKALNGSDTKKSEALFAKPVTPDRNKALDRIAKGTAYFSTPAKASVFMSGNGLSDTHKSFKISATRWDVVAKDVQTQEAQVPAAAPKQSAKARIEEARQSRTDYFTPGNIIEGYSGKDRVISYKAPDGNGEGWSVTVQSVVNQDGKWVVDPKDNRVRTHSTQPNKSDLSRGPVDREAAPVRNIQTANEPATSITNVVKNPKQAKESPQEFTAKNIDDAGDITIEFPTEDGKTARMTVNARQAIDALDKRSEALEIVRRCLG